MSFSTSTADRLAERRKEYKPTLSSEGGALRRREVANELRRDKRDRLLHAKRRKVEEGAGDGAGGGDGGAGGGGAALPSSEELGLAVGALLNHARGEERLAALRVVRRVVSGGGGDDEGDERARGLASPELVGVLARTLAGAAADGAAALEAAWCVTNIACGGPADVEAVLPCGPGLVALLASAAAPLAEQAAWALGNIAAESEGARRTVAANGAPAALARAMGCRLPRVARTAAWAACNLLRGEAPAGPFLDAGALPPILAALESAAGDDGSGGGGGGADAGYVADMAWVLTYLTAKEEGATRGLVEAGIIPRLVPLLAPGGGGGSDSLTTCPALRAIGNCVSLDGGYADAAVAEAGFLPGAGAALVSADTALAKEAAWVLSNIIAGGRGAAGAVVAAGLLPPLRRAAVAGFFPVKREALFALFNLAMFDEGLALLLGGDGSGDDAGALVGEYIGVISAPDVALARLGLSFVRRALDAGGRRGFELVAGRGGGDALEEAQYRLQQSDLGAVARGLLATYFEVEEEEEGEGEGGGGGFGAAAGGAWGPPPGAGAGRGAHMVLPAWAAAGAVASGSGSVPGARQATLGEFGFSR